MAAICIECWVGPKAVLSQKLIRCPLERSFEELFQYEVEAGSSLSRDRSDYLLKISTSSSGQPGTWKDIDISENIGLEVEFGCRYVRFQATVSQQAPPAKKVCERSAFDVLCSAIA